MMKKEEKKEKKPIDKREVFTKIMAGFLVALMGLATCSTFIYYIVANVQ